MDIKVFSVILEYIANNLGTIIAALIGAIALVKSNNSNISDKVNRAQWAFEMYISFAGIYLNSDTSEDLKKYKAFYYIFYAYTDDDNKKNIREIDSLINKNRTDEAEIQLLKMIDDYYKKYNLKQFSLKRNVSSKYIKRRLEVIEKKTLDKSDIEKK